MSRGVGGFSPSQALLRYSSPLARGTKEHEARAHDAAGTARPPAILACGGDRLQCRSRARSRSCADMRPVRCFSAGTCARAPERWGRNHPLRALSCRLGDERPRWRPAPIDGRREHRSRRQRTAPHFRLGVSRSVRLTRSDRGAKPPGIRVRSARVSPAPRLNRGALRPRPLRARWPGMFYKARPMRGTPCCRRRLHPHRLTNRA